MNHMDLYMMPPDEPIHEETEESYSTPKKSV